ncbi:MAG: hypothetical protein ABEJ05_04870 [Haloglomus sp.]
MRGTLPFTLVEEMALHLERRFRPLNIQIELATSATVDVDRLATATRTAMARHPMSRARRRPARPIDTRYRWQIPAEPGPVPIYEVDGDEHDVRTVRNRLYSRPFDLTEEPPFAIVVYRGGGIDGGDRLLQSTSHVVSDGVGLLRFTRAVLTAYRGGEPTADSISLCESRSLLADCRPETLADARDAAATVARRLREWVLSPTDIAEDGGSDRPGWGYERRVLDPESTARLIDAPPSGVTVNDVLLAALHRTIDRWNEAHGEPTGWLSVMMPVNVRPDDWFYQVMAMYTLFERVRTDRSDRRDPVDTLRTVTRQTTRIKERDLPEATYAALSLLPDLPVALERHLPDLLEGPGSRLLDTVVLTNLGNVPVSPSLEDGTEGRVWFAPPTWDQLPVGIAVGTFDGELHLFCRYRLTQFDSDGAARFVDLYLEQVERLADDVLPGMDAPDVHQGL